MKSDALDKESPVPLYYQLFLRVQSDIQNGLVQPGDLLGTEKEIQQRFGVSRATVRKALDELGRHGRLRRITGRGTFVAEPALRVHSPHLLSFTEEMVQRGLTPGARILTFNRVPCPAQAAEALECRPGDQVIHVRRLRTANDLPTILVDHYLAPAIRLQRDDLQQSLYGTLEQALGVRLIEAYHTVRAGRCSSDDAPLLDIESGEPVLQFERLTMGADGHPAVCEWGTARADRYEYTVHLHREI